VADLKIEAQHRNRQHLLVWMHASEESCFNEKQFNDVDSML
jgi:hypothetical protein